MAIHTLPCHQATSQGDERLISRAGPAVGSPCIHWRPVPHEGRDGAGGEVEAAQGVVHGVGDDDRAVVQEREALRFVEGDRVGRAVLEAAGAGADPPDDRLAVRRQLDQLVPGGVADQEGAAGQRDRLAGEAQHGGLGLRRHVRAVAAAEGALRRVLGLQLRHQALDGVRVALARVLCDDVALRVDDDERRPGADGVLLPGRELRVVQDRVLDAVALDRVHDRPVLGLVHKLRGVDPDDHDRVPVLLLQLAELVQDMQAVDAAEGPEIQDDDASPQVGEGVLLLARVQPAALAGQLGGADAGSAGRRGRGCIGHGSRVPPATDSHDSACPVVASTWSGTASWWSPTVRVPVGSSRRISEGTRA